MFLTDKIIKTAKSVLLCVALSTTGVVCAATGDNRLALANIFTNGMVVQRDVRIPVWGTATPGAIVEVKMGNSKFVTKVTAYGQWKSYLPKHKAGGPYTIEVREIPRGKTIKISDVLVGDVYLCSGQSNMELPIRRCMDNTGVSNVAKSYSNNNIRYVKVPQQFNYVRPNADMRVIPWQNITPQNCSEVGALCYFFAKNIQESSNVPVGIINSSVGGTPVEAWTPREELAKHFDYSEELKKQKYHQLSWPDSINRIESRACFAWDRKMIAKDTIVNRWKTPGYSFDSWKRVNMFSDWAKGVNGSYWFRNTVKLPASVDGKAGIIRVGAMRDADSVFVNGTFVGFTSYQYPPRIYKIAPGVLHEGENEIVVHLLSQHDNPRFVKDKLYRIEVGEDYYPIGEEWQMQVGSTMEERPFNTYFVAGYTGLYNAMISPLQDFPVKGMLWYQGEANLDNAEQYADLFDGMVKSWRKQWGKKFPVVVVQLPRYMDRHDNPVETSWAQMRWQQYLAARNISKCGLVPTLDTGEWCDIHPQEKDVIGERAATVMTSLLNGKKKHIDSPNPVRTKVVGDGKAVIEFDTEFNAPVGTELKSFAVKYAGGYKWTKAVVTSPKAVTVDIPQKECVVRYGWDDFCDVSLFSKTGIPSPQFQINIK